MFLAIITKATQHQMNTDLMLRLMEREDIAKVMQVMQQSYSRHDPYHKCCNVHLLSSFWGSTSSSGSSCHQKQQKRIAKLWATSQCNCHDAPVLTVQ